MSEAEYQDQERDAQSEMSAAKPYSMQQTHSLRDKWRNSSTYQMPELGSLDGRWITGDLSKNALKRLPEKLSWRFVCRAFLRHVSENPPEGIARQHLIT